MPTDIVSQSTPASEHDRQKQIEVLVRFIKHHQYVAKARKKVREGWIPKETFWDEFIDVNCTPMGQDTEYSEDAYWHSMQGVWYLVGAYLAEAMSLHDDDLG